VLDTEVKLLIHAIRIAAFNTLTALVRDLRLHTTYARAGEEGHTRRHRPRRGNRHPDGHPGSAAHRTRKPGRTRTLRPPQLHPNGLSRHETGLTIPGQGAEHHAQIKTHIRSPEPRSIQRRRLRKQCVDRYYGAPGAFAPDCSVVRSQARRAKTRTDPRDGSLRSAAES